MSSNFLGTSFSSNASSSASRWATVSSPLAFEGRVPIEGRGKGQNQGEGGRKKEQGEVNWDDLVDGVFKEEIAKIF